MKFSKFLAIAGATALMALAAPPAYKVVAHIKVGGSGGWDYDFLDSANHRLYVSHAGESRVEVIDTANDKVVGNIPDTKGVHGIAVAPDLGRGFTSNGMSNDVSVFELGTLKLITRVNTGRNPDSIIYEPVTKRVLTFNGTSHDATIIDAKSGQAVTASLALGGKPEFSQVDGKGNVYVNIEDTNEVAVINAKDSTVTRRYSIAPCDGPSGLAIDAAKMRLYSVCSNKLMVISDAAAGKVLGTAPIGSGVDGVAFDDGYAFSANGNDSNITVVGEVSPGKFDAVATVETMRGARTIGVDHQTHKLYLPTADFATATPAAGAAPGGRAPRPQAVADTFQVVVVGR